MVVQALETLEETRWLLECARAAPIIQGVVGWAPLEADDLSEVLGSFLDTGKLVGLREIIHAKPNGYLDRPGFNRGIRQLTSLNLTYDILIKERQLEEATRLVDQHPCQRGFILKISQ